MVLWTLSTFDQTYYYPKSQGQSWICPVFAGRADFVYHRVALRYDHGVFGRKSCWRTVFRKNHYRCQWWLKEMHTDCFRYDHWIRNESLARHLELQHWLRLPEELFWWYQQIDRWRSFQNHQRELRELQSYPWGQEGIHREAGWTPASERGS